jgi:hypothetical protein
MKDALLAKHKAKYREIVCVHTKFFLYPYITCINMGRDSVVGTATRYELDCPGIEYRWRRDF